MLTVSISSFTGRVALMLVGFELLVDSNSNETPDTNE